MKNTHAPTRTTFNHSSTHYPEGFNPDDYKQDLGADSFTQEEIEILQTLWNIMKNFVDLGWGVDSVQLALPDLFAADRSDSVKPANDNNEKGANHE